MPSSDDRKPPASTISLRELPWGTKATRVDSVRGQTSSTVCTNISGGRGVELARGDADIPPLHSRSNSADLRPLPGSLGAARRTADEDVHPSRGDRLCARELPEGPSSAPALRRRSRRGRPSENRVPAPHRCALAGEPRDRQQRDWLAA